MKKLVFLTLLSLCSTHMIYAQNKIALGKSNINIRSYKGVALPSVLFLNVHEDEQTSINAILQVRKLIPVNFFYLSHEKTRNINFLLKGDKNVAVDPNRIYTFKGRKATLKKFGQFSFKANHEIKKLEAAVKKIVSKFNVVVTLHNNTDVNYTINSYAKGNDESDNTAALHVSDDWDTDDFIYTTEKSYFDYFKKENINVILQDNSACVNDGSLSVYCGKHNIPYINIEAQKGHLKEQVKLIEAVIGLLQRVD